VTFVCDVLQLGEQQRFFSLEIFTIDGMVNQVITNARSDPRKVSIHKGIETEEMLIGQFKIQKLIRVRLIQFKILIKRVLQVRKATNRYAKMRY
jgi:hypothetical protein